MDTNEIMNVANIEDGVAEIAEENIVENLPEQIQDIAEDCACTLTVSNRSLAGVALGTIGGAIIAGIAVNYGIPYARKKFGEIRAKLRAKRQAKNNVATDATNEESEK